jgi:hypothetical protein
VQSFNQFLKTWKEAAEDNENEPVSVQVKGDDFKELRIRRRPASLKLGESRF